MKHLLSVILFFILLNMTGCHNTKLNPDLLVAESIIEAQPDSAYRILKNIKSLELTSDADNAKYALLMTQAMVKNDIPFDSDSLISSAVNYYSRHPTDSDLMKSLYYKGEFLYNNNSLDSSTMYAIKSRELAIKLNNHFWRAKNAKLMSDILADNYFLDEALKMNLEAAEYFKKAGKDRFYLFTLANISTDYCNLKQPEKGLALIDSVLSIGKALNDSILILYCYRRQVLLLDKLKRYDEAIKPINELKNSGHPEMFNSEEINFIVKYEIEKHNFDSARVLLNELLKNASTSREYALAYNNYRRLYMTIGDFHKAMIYTDSTYAQQYVILSKVTKQSPKEIQKQFYSDLAEKNQKRNESLSLYIIIICLAFFLLSAIGVIIYRKKNAVIAEKVNQLLMMSQELRNFGKDSIEPDKEQRLRDEIERLYKGKWEFLNVILNEYLKNIDDKKFADNFVLRVNECISRIKTEENLSRIEESVNRYMDDCISVLRRNCPDLTESDLQFVALYVSGFSRNAICIMLDLKIKSFYSRKGRIQEKIARYDFPEKDLILKGLSSD